MTIYVSKPYRHCKSIWISTFHVMLISFRDSSIEGLNPFAEGFVEVILLWRSTHD